MPWLLWPKAGYGQRPASFGTLWVWAQPGYGEAGILRNPWNPLESPKGARPFSVFTPSHRYVRHGLSGLYGSWTLPPLWRKMTIQMTN